MPNLKDLPNDLLNDEIASELPLMVIGKLSKTCRRYHDFFKGSLLNLAWHKLCSAIVDDNKTVAISILNSHPQLSLGYPQKTVVKSQYTHQKFNMTNPLLLTIKRRQFEMTALLLSYYKSNDINHNQIKEKILANVHPYTQQFNGSFAVNTIVTPHEYKIYLQSLLNIISQETFINNTINSETKSALEMFRNILLPKRPIDPENYLDLELFLYTAYLLFHQQHHNLTHSQNWLFCRQIIGFIQSLLPKETATLFCKGIFNPDSDQIMINEYDLINDSGPFLATYQPIETETGIPILKNGDLFYRQSSAQNTGLGFNQVCGYKGEFLRSTIGLKINGPDYFGEFLLNKSLSLSKLGKSHYKICSIL